MENKTSSSFEYLIIVAAIGMVLFALLKKLVVQFIYWLSFKNHQIEFAIFLSLIVFILSNWFLTKIQKAKLKNKLEKSILGPEPQSVFCGHTDDKNPVFIKTKQRIMHTQVIGTTNAGKTESVILPWAIQDMEQGRGFVLIDGKADNSLLEKLRSYAEKFGRLNDFKVFSLANLDESFQFNPLIGGTAEEIAERVFNSFEFENPHYRSVQYEIFAQLLRIFEDLKITPTFLRLHQAIAQPNRLYVLMKDQPNNHLKQWLHHFVSLSTTERSENTSGLSAALSHFAFGKTSELFNTEKSSILLDEALKRNQIIYFQLPVLLSPFLGKATGKLLLQNLQYTIANRHRSKEKSYKFFSIYLDDFTEYLYPGFVSILNKSRSANVGIVFAHQALGDLKTLGEPIANSILTNSNLKVFMRGNEPETAEYFSKVIGTTRTIKYTKRTIQKFGSDTTTGEASSREADEFIIHPNTFKSELGVGEGIMLIPHEGGSKTIRIKFKKYDDLKPVDSIKIVKQICDPLPERLSV